MKDRFEIAGGTVVGYEHAKAGRNNQDAFYWTASDLAIVAIVADGCSDAPHSEVGAKIGARIVAETVSKEVENYNSSVTAFLSDPYMPYPFWDNVRIQALQELDKVVNSIRVKKQAVLDYFLFTIVGALITPWSTTIFSVGDGIIFLNGELLKIGPFLDNTPPYLGYSLLDKTPVSLKPEWLQFTVHKLINTRSVESILIGTDGLEDLDGAREQKTPSKMEVVGPVSQFWEDNRYFKNPDMIRRKLSLVNRAVTKIDWENRNITKERGLLPDDTTLVVIRRKK